MVVRSLPRQGFKQRTDKFWVLRIGTSWSLMPRKTLLCPANLLPRPLGSGSVILSLGQRLLVSPSFCGSDEQEEKRQEAQLAFTRGAPPCLAGQRDGQAFLSRTTAMRANGRCLAEPRWEWLMTLLARPGGTGSFLARGSWSSQP